ncbi:MAG: sensor domain-containing diguanylate cyclase [Desulfobulbus sp.]
MSIRFKVRILIVALFTILSVSGFLIQRGIILPYFQHLEQRNAEGRMRLVLDAIDRELVQLDQVCADWAADSTLHNRLANPPSPLPTISISDRDRIHLAFICRSDGSPTWSHRAGFDHRIPPDLLQNLRTQASASADLRHSGVIVTSDPPLLFASRTLKQHDGAVSGFVVAGRFLDSATVTRLREQTRVPFAILTPPGQDQLCGAITVDPAAEPKAGKQAVPSSPNALASQNVRSGYCDQEGRVLFEVQFLQERDITRQGIARIWFSPGLTVLLALAMFAVLDRLLQTLLFRPIQRLTEHAAHLEREGDYSVRLGLRRNDEIGRLGHSLDAMVRTIDEQTRELRLANNRLRRLSMRDGLTGIANRRLFDQSIQREWRRAGRAQTPLSLILLDVDFFKRYNDTYGHQQGDQALISVANAMQQRVRRQIDLAARYGGEEFILILPNTGEDGALTVAEKLRQDILDLQIEHHTSGISPFLTISLGVATTVPPASGSGDDGLSVTEFLSMADQALYQAKHQGRNRTVVFRRSATEAPPLP